MNILIGSNGGLTGIYLAKQYKKMDGVRVLGADSVEDCVGRFFVEKQFKLPVVSDNDFISSLMNILNREKVDIYLPTNSNETRIIAYYAEEIKKRTSTKFLISPLQTYDSLDNKADANENLLEIGIPVPKCVEEFECEYPIIMKKDIGSGSNGTIIIDNKEIHRAYKESFSNFSFYHIIHGPEFTVDCMFDDMGKLIGMNQRERVKINGGAVSISRNNNTFDISPWINKIIHKWLFRGCVNFQYILEDGVPYFIDVNLRFPAGGLPLSVESGLNIPKLIVEVLNKNVVEQFFLSKEKSSLSMYRYYEEIFE